MYNSRFNSRPDHWHLAGGGPRYSRKDLAERWNCTPPNVANILLSYPDELPEIRKVYKNRSAIALSRIEAFEKAHSEILQRICKS